MISIVAAMSENYVIGANGQLPWHIKDDLQRFRLLTMGKTVLMGRKTWDSLPSSKLPGRECVVVTQNPVDYNDAAEVIISHPEFMYNVADDFTVIGGQTMYEYFLPFADELHLTIVKRYVDGDTFFPKIDFWNFMSMTIKETDEYKFLRMQRINK